jgi:GNAT superfamily N-acetyltransferase
VPNLDRQCADVQQAVEDLLAESHQDLWGAIATIEFLLDQKSFLSRVQQVRKEREGRSVEILDYQPEFHADFKRLNEEWIAKYFEMEAADYQSLNHPEEKILKPGGHILMARYQGAIVGSCALIKVSDETYELAKMSVTEKVQGQGIGWRLGQAAIQKARELGTSKLFLESNTKLEPAIKLYQKLGFQRVVGSPSPYARCNIQMELNL